MPESDLMSLIYLSLLLAMLAWWYLGDWSNNLSKTLQQAMIWVLIFLGAIAAYGLREVIGGQMFLSTPTARADGSYELARKEDGHFYATIHVDDAPIEMVVDTGASLVVLTKADARKMGIDPDALEYWGRADTANGTVRTAPLTIDRLRFGETVFYDVPASVNDGDLFESLLGMSLLERFSNIEMRANIMRLTP